MKRLWISPQPPIRRVAPDFFSASSIVSEGNSSESQEQQSIRPVALELFFAFLKNTNTF